MLYWQCRGHKKLVGLNEWKEPGDVLVVSVIGPPVPASIQGHCPDRVFFKFRIIKDSLISNTLGKTWLCSESLVKLEYFRVGMDCNLHSSR